MDHDIMVLWAYDNMEEIIKKNLNINRFGKFDHIVKKQMEYPLTVTKYAKHTTTKIDYEEPIASIDLMCICVFCDNIGKRNFVTFLFEIKPEINPYKQGYTVGEVLRQMEFYIIRYEGDIEKNGYINYGEDAGNNMIVPVVISTKNNYIKYLQDRNIHFVEYNAINLDNNHFNIKKNLDKKTIQSEDDLQKIFNKRTTTFEENLRIVEEEHKTQDINETSKVDRDVTLLSKLAKELGIDKYG